MGFMLMPVGIVAISEDLVSNHEEVFRVALLGGLREVEGAGDDRLSVDDHDLVVCDSIDFNSSQPHQIENSGTTSAKVLYVTVPLAL